jgi:hypothetical protein
LGRLAGKKAAAVDAESSRVLELQMQMHTLPAFPGSADRWASPYPEDPR